MYRAKPLWKVIPLSSCPDILIIRFIFTILEQKPELKHFQFPRQEKMAS
jgi:hypothetical protein